MLQNNKKKKSNLPPELCWHSSVKCIKVKRFAQSRLGKGCVIVFFFAHPVKLSNKCLVILSSSDVSHTLFANHNYISMLPVWPTEMSKLIKKEMSELSFMEQTCSLNSSSQRCLFMWWHGGCRHGKLLYWFYLSHLWWIFSFSLLMWMR